GGTDAETVPAREENRARQLWNQLARSIDQPPAKRKSQQVLAFHPFVQAKAVRGVQLRHEGGKARAAWRAIHRMVAKDDEVAVPSAAKLRVDERGDHLGPRPQPASRGQPGL